MIIAAVAAKAAPEPHPADTVIVLGDSNIWLAGDSCNNHQGWMGWFRDLWQPGYCRSYARSGASWSNTSLTTHNPDENIAILGDNNVIYNQVTRLQQAWDAGEQPRPTIIFVSAGGNDAWFAHKRPREFDLTVDQAFACPDSVLLQLHPSQVQSLAGSIRQNCLRLQALFPEARIILLTPPQMIKVGDALNTRISDIIEESGRRLGIATIRLDGPEPISRDDEARQRVRTYDGIHTSVEGARHVAEYVIRHM